MSRPTPPVLTIRYDGAERTFAAGNDVAIGRDLRADVRVVDPSISRVHLLVRYDQDRWVAVDNGSLNGLFVNNHRVPTVDIQDGQRINIGNPDGPALTFEVGRHQGSAGRPPERQRCRYSTRLRPPRCGGTAQARPGTGSAHVADTARAPWRPTGGAPTGPQPRLQLPGRNHVIHLERGPRRRSTIRPPGAARFPRAGARAVRAQTSRRR